MDKAKDFLETVKVFKSIIYIGLGILALVILFNMMTFRVYETEQAVVTRFGEITKVVVGKEADSMKEEMKNNSKLQNIIVKESKGINFKMPFVDKVTYHSDRLLTYDTTPRQVVSKDKKIVVFDNFAQWEITNPALFQITLKNETAAHKRIDDTMFAVMNQNIGKTEAHKLISDAKTNDDINIDVIKKSNEVLSDFGMKIVDVQIRRTDYPEENKESIFARMRSEREKIAQQYISEGEEEKQKIISGAQKQATIIIADAKEKSAVIKGQADAEATRIYAQTYSKDPNFYKFYQTLETYKKTIDNETVLVIPKDSEFAKGLFGE